jgi:hypothetical protein
MRVKLNMLCNEEICKVVFLWWLNEVGYGGLDMIHIAPKVQFG